MLEIALELVAELELAVLVLEELVEEVFLLTVTPAPAVAAAAAAAQSRRHAAAAAAARAHSVRAARDGLSKGSVRRHYNKRRRKISRRRKFGIEASSVIYGPHRSSFSATALGAANKGFIERSSRRANNWMRETPRLVVSFAEIPAANSL